MQTISAEQLRNTLAGAEGAPVINVLDHSDYEERHIPGSINIPFDSDDFIARVRRHVDDRADPVIVYCASQECPLSERAAESLERSGFTNVRDFEAGMKGWELAGFEAAGRNVEGRL